MSRISRKDLFNYASTDTKPTSVPAHSRNINSDNGDEEVFDGARWRPAGNITMGPVGQARLRHEAALAGTAVTFTWASPGIRALKLTIASEAAGTAELPAAVAYCINPPSAATRDAWLTAADSISADSQMLVAFADKENDTLVFSSPITTIGLKRLWGSQALTAIAVGVEVES